MEIEIQAVCLLGHISKWLHTALYVKDKPHILFCTISPNRSPGSAAIQANLMLEMVKLQIPEAWPLNTHRKGINTWSIENPVQKLLQHYTEKELKIG